MLIGFVCLWFLSSCATQEPSAVKKLQAHVNPIDAMKLPDRESGSKQNAAASPTIEIRAQGDANIVPAKVEAVPFKVIDKNKINRLPESPAPSRYVKISGNNVPLRQGPGPQYKKVHLAARGDRFKLLSVQRNPKDRRAWYLVNNDEGKRFFVSELVSTITDGSGPFDPALGKSPYEVEKEVIHARENRSHIRSVFDPTPSLPSGLRKAKHITLNFEGTEVYDVITTFCELLKIDYLIEGNIKGKVTLQTFNKIPVRDLYVLLEQILALHNITVVKSGNFYRFLPAADASQKPMSIHYGNDPFIPDRDRMIIQIIPLQYISVESMKKILQPLMSPNATFLDVPETKNLMLIEMAANVKRILKIVEALDIDKLASSDIQLFRLNHADSLVVVDELLEIFASMGYNDALGSALNFLALERLNSILVVNAFEKILPTIEFWIKKLDQPVSEGEISTFVYYVQNADAIQLADLLTAMFQSRNSEPGKPRPLGEVKKTSAKYNDKKKPTQKKPSKPDPKESRPPLLSAAEPLADAFDGEITILPDQDTNSLIIRTSPRNYPALLELIKKLDLFPQQVLIEVLIIDLTLDAETRAGLEWALKGSTGGTTFIGGVSKTPGSGATLGSQIGNATASLLQPGGSLLASDPNKLIALLQAFATDSKANVLANPILVTSDNKAANISIADEIPIESSTITTPTAGQPLTQTTIEYRSVGIKLDIVPKINSDNFVNLKISQEISSQGPFVGSTPSFSTRLLNTEVVLKDNQVLVMGGLMRTDVIDSNEGIPVLRKIPLLGKLFSTDTDSTSKTELMIFITPHIISNAEDSEFVTQQFRRRLGNLKQLTPQS